MPVTFEDVPEAKVSFEDAPQEKPVDLKKEWESASPLKRLGLLLKHYDYMKSVEGAFAESAIPEIPRADATRSKNPLAEIGAAEVNTGVGIARGVATAGGLSMINPVTAPAALVYSAPYFLKKALESLKTIGDSKNTQEATEAVLNTAGNALGAVGGGTLGAKGILKQVRDAVPNKQITSALNAKAGTPLAQANAFANSVAMRTDPLQAHGIGDVQEPPPNILSGMAGSENNPVFDNTPTLPTPDPTATQAAIEKMLGIGEEKTPIKVTFEDPRTDPEYEAKVKKEAELRNANDKAAGVNDEVTNPAADTILADRLQQSETSAPGKTTRTEPTLGELVGTDVEYNGYKGKLIRDEEGNFAVLQSSTKGSPNLVEIADSGKDPSKIAGDLKVNPQVALEPVLGRGLKDKVEPRSNLPANEPAKPVPLPKVTFEEPGKAETASGKETTAKAAETTPEGVPYEEPPPFRDPYRNPERPRGATSYDAKRSKNPEVNSLRDEMIDSESRPIDDREPSRSPGERKGIFRTATDALRNKANAVADFIEGTGRKTLFRDVAFDRLDNNANGEGFLSRVFGGKTDRNYNKEQNIIDELASPIRQVLKDNPLDKTSMQRVNIYATEMRNRLNPDLPNTHLTDSKVKPEVLKDIMENGLTPAEQRFYDQARAALDKSGPMIQKLMKDLYGVDVSLEKGYWPLQRDYSLIDKKVLKPESKAGKGDVVDFNDLSTWNEIERQIFPNQKTTKTNQGITIERVPEATGAINLESNVIDRHLRTVARLIAHQADLRTLGELARGKEFAEKYGRQGQDYVLKWLDTVARDTDPAGATRWKTLDKLRNNTSVAVLALRFLSQAKHISNAAIAVREVRPDYLAAGLKEAWSDRGTAFLKKNFAETYQRFGGEGAIKDLVDGNRWEKGTAKVFWIERAIDSALARATVLGKYMQEMKEKGVSPDEVFDHPIDETAQRRALVTSRKVVTSPLLKDLPQGISRGTIAGGNVSIAKAMTQFQQTLWRQAGYFKHEIFDVGVGKGENVKAASALLAFMAALTIETGLTHANKPFTQALGNAVFDSHNAPAQKKEDSFGQEMVMDGIRKIPLSNLVVAPMTKDYSTGIPIVDSATHGLHAVGGVLGITKGAHGGPLSAREKARARVDALNAVGSAVGIPGITTATQLYNNTELPPPAR